MSRRAQRDKRAADPRTTLLRLLSRLGAQRGRLVLVTIMAATGTLLGVLAPKFLGHATDSIFSGVIGRQLPPGLSHDDAVRTLRDDGRQSLADIVSAMNVVPGRGVDLGAVASILSIVCCLYLASALLVWLQARLLNTAVQETVANLRSDVQAKVLRLPTSYIESTTRGELLSRVTNDIDNVSQSIQQTFSLLLSAVVTVVAIVAVMVWISPLLAVVAIASVPLSLWATKLVAHRAQPHFADQWAHVGSLNSRIEETYTAHDLVTSFGHVDEIERLFAEENHNLFRSARQAQVISGVSTPIITLLGNINFVAIAVVGGFRIASGSVTLGDVQAIIQYSRAVTQPLSQVGSIANVVQSGLASAERVFEVLDAPEGESHPSVEAGPATTAPTARPAPARVEFDHVSFRYRPQTPLIDDLSFVVEPGATVAVVGPTGAGKSTLVNLLMRFHDVDSGRILLDGTDIQSMPHSDLRARTGMVLQDSWLFGGTIAENIAYGDPSASHDKVRAAARLAHVDRFTASLPDGLHTVIDGDGTNLSAGEKQLIAIARAFLVEPSILILDEATSSVDTRTEKLIQRAMAELRRDRTSFVIAHRLATVRDADLILVMRNGTIVEHGTHDGLLTRNGAYAALYGSQFGLQPAR